MELHEKRIRKAVSEYLSDYLGFTDDPVFAQTVESQEKRDHVISIGTSILQTKWGDGPVGGGFARAIVRNDLRDAFGQADNVNINCIRFYCTLISNLPYVS
jgi:hypothetical protein